MFRKIKQGFKNIVRWLPVIWNDRQWDANFLFVILHRKLCLMYRFFESDDSASVHTEKEMRKLKTAILLCKRIADGDYSPLVEGELLYPKIYDSSVPYEDDMQKQDIELLGKILKSQSGSWWD